MTDLNNAAQPGLTDDEIEALAKKHIAPHADRLDKLLPHRVPYQQTEQFRRVKALIGDLLSKLRAEGVQAGDERALTANQRKEFIRRTSYISEADRDTRAGFVDEIARAALASAPVAVQEFKAAFPNGVLTSARFHELWERAGKTRNGNYTLLENLTWQVGQFGNLVAQAVGAPVAGEDDHDAK